MMATWGDAVLQEEASGPNVSLARPPGGMHAPVIMKFLRQIGSAALDASVVFSFGHSGYALRRHDFVDPDVDVSLEGKVCVVTGASSGLGRVTARALDARGAKVIAVCRDEARAQKALEGTSVEIAIADLSQVAECHRIANWIEKQPKIDVLVNNAGILPTEHVVTPEGNDAAFATNLLATYILTERLVDAIARSEMKRIVNVVSGGMFLVKFDANELAGERSPYDGVRVYAQTKRAQMMLTERWARLFSNRSITVNACHPGWAKTKGVAESIPRFEKLMGSILRTEEEGADTIVFLAASNDAPSTSGDLYFDRRKVRPVVLPWLAPTAEDRDALVALCEAKTALTHR
jgi:dehydrogenase/reductase SDR family member 12